jgi:hypothetical protein
VPDQIDEVADGLEQAYQIYTDPAGMAWSGEWWGKTTVILRHRDGGQVLPNCGNPLEDTETIEIERDSNVPYYLAHHELFHIFQHDHFDCLSWPGNWVAGVGPWWWMEATADWASGYVARSGNFGNSSVYYQRLWKYLGSPDARIDFFENPGDEDTEDPREYGAFIVAEYMSERVGTGGPGQPDYNLAIVRRTWEEIGTMPTPQSPVEAFAEVLSDYGLTMDDFLGGLARANYLLDYDSSDVAAWRAVLEPRPLTAGEPDGRAPARPARSIYVIGDGERIEGSLSAVYGGTHYLEVVPPPGTTGTLLFDIGVASTPINARVMTLDYRQPPADPVICEDESLPIDSNGTGVVAVNFSSACRYAVLMVTGLHDGSVTPLDWGVQLIADEEQGQCVETFSRTVAAGGWGLSEFGSSWESWTIGQDDPQASVDGLVGRIDGALPSNMAIAGLGLSLDTELLVKWRFTGPGTNSNHYFEISLHSEGTGQNTSGAYSREFISGTDFSKTIVNHDHYQNIGTPHFAAPDGQWMWMRLRMDDGTQTRMRVWPDGQAEPQNWQRSIVGPSSRRARTPSRSGRTRLTAARASRLTLSMSSRAAEPPS